jgi:hypothetical protein
MPSNVEMSGTWGLGHSGGPMQSGELHHMGIELQHTCIFWFPLSVFVVEMGQLCLK